VTRLRSFPGLRDREDLPENPERRAALAMCAVAAGLHDCRGGRCRKNGHQRDKGAAWTVLDALGLIEEDQ
jgi:hypothetical protein